MRLSCIAVLTVGFVLAGCSGGTRNSVPDSGSYNLAFSDPAPYSTYLKVSAAVPGTRLPGVRYMKSRRFSNYLTSQTGCAVNTAYPISVLGSKKAPSGYMVPVSC